MDRIERGPAQPPEEFVRFSVGQRVEHLVTMLSFTALVLTGLPQKFYGDGWAQAIIMGLGGIETVRLVHRMCAALFCLEGIYHVAHISYQAGMGNFAPSMIPGLRDVRDAVNTFKYCIGTSSVMPKFGRFDYRQKFEYWGVVMGWLIMASTGLIMVFPAQATQLLPGAFIPAAKEMHGGEALLVLLIIVTWHLYGAHLNPQRFPGDISIFTGRISRERMIQEHPLEYARLIRARMESAPDMPEIQPEEVPAGDRPAALEPAMAGSERSGGQAERG